MQKSITCPNCGSPASETDSDGLHHCLHCASVYTMKELRHPPSFHRKAPSQLAGRPAQSRFVYRLAAAALAFALLLIGIAILFQRHPSPAEAEIAASLAAQIDDRDTVLPQTQALHVDDTPGRAKTVSAELSTLVPLHDSIRGVYFCGLIKNTGEAALQYSKVAVKLFNENGVVLREGFGYATRDYLLPGEESIVIVLISNAPDYYRFTAATELREVSSLSKIERANIELSETKMNFSAYSRLDISGVVTNHDKRVCRLIKIVALVYKDGEIAGSGLLLSAKELKPGASLPFSLYITSLLDSADSMVLDYQASFK